jgi:class 3 adenylate cyclase/tetratricopeptide (TPR) repeat protein
VHCQAELPPSARFCPACGQPTKRGAETPSPPAAAYPAGERKQVTVLFADFAGFTSFVHKRDAEDVRDFMNSVWAKLDAIIEAHGGWTEKHIGDAVMAVFGARQSRENDPVQAVRAGLAMQQSLNHFQTAGVPAAMQMRIGIHTGVAVVGPLGTSGEFAATGDTVNLANRLEQNAPAGSVLISHDTLRHVYGLFDVQSVAPFSVKGRPEPVQAYLILRAKPRALAVRIRGVEGVETEMIGREQELAQIQAGLALVIERRQSHVLTVVGEAGIGKSCLLTEFQKWAELLPYTVRWFYGRATPEMASLPFSLLRDVFAARFEIRDSDSPMVAREKLEHGIVELLKGKSIGSEDARTQARSIGQLIGFDFSPNSDPHDPLKDSEQTREIALRSLADFFSAISETPASLATPEIKGAILVAEDIHWGDEGSLDALIHLAKSCRRVPLLIVCFARPTLFEQRPHWDEESPSRERLDLEPLSRQNSMALVQSILRKAPKIPQALRELVIANAEGVPFYIEELIKMFIDQRVVVPGTDEWQIQPGKLADATVPATLTGILQARLDGLHPAERSVLQRASVVGRIFWDDAVEHLGLTAVDAGEPPVAKSEIPEALAGLRRKEIIFRSESSAFSGAVEYSFKHELLRNVAYESLLKKSRRAHHAALAQWLIERSGDRVNEFAGLVATHFEQAGKLEDSAEWYGRAGEKARESYAPASAIQYFTKALALLPAQPGEGANLDGRRMRWQEGLVDVLGAQAKFAEALEACNQLKESSERLGNPSAQARAWNGLAFLNERLGRNRVSIECAEQAERLARQAGPEGREELVRALLLKGWAHYRISDAAAVLALGEQTLKLCLEFGNRNGQATSYKLHGVAHLQLGHFLEADRYFSQGLALYRELGDRRNTAAMWSNLGESARFRGDYQAAEQLYEKALAAVREIGHRESEAIYLSNLSAARLGLKKFPEAEEALREALALTAGGDFCSLAETWSGLSEACLGQGKVAEALEAGRRGLALARESENDLDIGTAWRALAHAVAATETDKTIPANGERTPAEEQEAASCFAASLAVFKKIKAEVEQARTLRAWAEYELNRGASPESRARLEEARTIFGKLGARAEMDRVSALLQG